jgi:hypothetical protein
MIISIHTARSGVRNGTHLVRQYGDDGSQFADLNHMPRTVLERQRAPTVMLHERRHLILDNISVLRTDHVAVTW